MRTMSQKKQKRVEIARGIELIDHAVWIPAHKLLAISDTHIGYEEALNKNGVLVPRFEFQEMTRRIQRIIDEIKKQSEIKIILINGDVKHEFGTISGQEWRETLWFLDLLASAAPHTIIVKGNHDTIIGPIARKRRVKLVDGYLIGDILFIHGNVIPGDFEKIMKQHQTKTIIIGNEHPAITIGTRLRCEKYKCFLKGEYKGKTLIVLPSFNTLAEGTDVAQGKILSPFIQKPKKCEVYVIDEQSHTHRVFGTVGKIHTAAQNL